MFHKAVSINMLEGTALEVRFEDGKVMRYDLSALFEKYPGMTALRDRELFLSGRLQGGYGIVFTEELDVDTETIYEDGTLIRMEQPANTALASAVSSARARCGMTQKDVAQRAGMDQSDYSKLERGLSNPSWATLNRIAEAMGCQLKVSME